LWRRNCILKLFTSWKTRNFQRQRISFSTIKSAFYGQKTFALKLFPGWKTYKNLKTILKSCLKFSTSFQWTKNVNFINQNVWKNHKRASWILCFAKENYCRDTYSFHQQLLDKIKTAAANSVFIKLWLDVKHSTLNHYFAFVVG
jgi:hypothetical protein